MRYLMSSSSFPKKINKIPTINYLEKHFNPIKSITGKTYLYSKESINIVFLKDLT